MGWYYLWKNSKFWALGIFIRPLIILNKIIFYNSWKWKFSQVTEAIQAVLLAEVQQHLKSLRNTPRPDPVAQHTICERMRISSKVGWTEEIELPYVGNSSPLKSKWAVYLFALSMTMCWGVRVYSALFPHEWSHTLHMGSILLTVCSHHHQAIKEHLILS